MKSHEVLRNVFKKHGAKRVADGMGMALPSLYKWSQQDGGKASGGLNPLERMAALIRVTQDLRPVQWLCAQAGGCFVANAAPASLPAELLPAENQTVREFGDLIAVVSVSAGDNCITAAEAADIRERWEQLKSVTEGFVRDCERGHFLNRESPVAGAAAKSFPAKVSPAAPRPSARL